jgi:hypothetical protein
VGIKTQRASARAVEPARPADTKKGSTAVPAIVPKIAVYALPLLLAAAIAYRSFAAPAPVTPSPLNSANLLTELAKFATQRSIELVLLNAVFFLNRKLADVAQNCFLYFATRGFLGPRFIPRQPNIPPIPPFRPRRNSV